MNQEEVLKAYWNIIGHYKKDYAVLQNEEGKLAVIDAKENEAPIGSIVKDGEYITPLQEVEPEMRKGILDLFQ